MQIPTSTSNVSLLLPLKCRYSRTCRPISLIVIKRHFRRPFTDPQMVPHSFEIKDYPSGCCTDCVLCHFVRLSPSIGGSLCKCVIFMHTKIKNNKTHIFIFFWKEKMQNESNGCVWRAYSVCANSFLFFLFVFNFE